ncbi:hypothetical protein Ais01nite_80140 [Asanoa ishikariensis]|nr:hypothetical protein Ais01nite_80140 [Asanoa ishikariensis]
MFGYATIDRLTRELTVTLRDPSAILRAAGESVDLSMVDAGSRFRRAVERANADVAAAKGLPAGAVLLVEVDTAKALDLGVTVIKSELAARGRLAAAPTRARAAGYWATKVNAVRLSDDEEPWIKGGAEIFSVVTGFGLDGVPRADIVQMPYRDNDGTTYYPNQLLVHFSAYKYNLTDVVMMGDDGDTNYQALA